MTLIGGDPGVGKSTLLLQVLGPAWDLNPDVAETSLLEIISGHTIARPKDYKIYICVGFRR